MFFLENGNADVSQRNVLFIARGECAKQAQSIAGTFLSSSFVLFALNGLLKVDFVDDFAPLYLVSLEPYMNKSHRARLIVSLLPT